MLQFIHNQAEDFSACTTSARVDASFTLHLSQQGWAWTSLVTLHNCSALSLTLCMPLSYMMSLEVKTSSCAQPPRDGVPREVGGHGAPSPAHLGLQQPVGGETCMQVRKQQLELDMEQQTGSK